MVCQGLVFTAVCVGSIVWRRSSSGLWKMGTLGSRTSDSQEMDIAAMPHLSFGSFLAETHAQEVGNFGFKIFSSLLHMIACPSVVIIMLYIIFVRFFLQTSIK